MQKSTMSKTWINLAIILSLHQIFTEQIRVSAWCFHKSKIPSWKINIAGKAVKLGQYLVKYE